MKKTSRFATAIRQQEIVKSARKIITTAGVESLTIRAMATDLKLTEGALYRHFKSKKDIIDLLIVDISKTLLKAIDDAADKENDPLMQLRNILAAHLSYAEQRKGITFVVINEALNLKDKYLQKKMSEVIDKYLKKIRSILCDGVVTGVFRKDMNAATASVIFFGMVQSTVTLWALGGYGNSLDKGHLDEIFDIYKKGIMKRPT